MVYILCKYTLKYCAHSAIMVSWESGARISGAPLKSKMGKVATYMSLKCKIDVLAALKTAGYSTYKIRKEKLFGESTLTRLRAGEFQSLEVVNQLCALLNCQPGDIMEYIDDNK